MSDSSAQSQLQNNKALARQWFEALNAFDTDALLALYNEDTIVWTAGSTSISGEHPVATLREAASGVLQLFPQGLKFTIKQMTAEEDRVAIEAESYGKHASGDIYHNLYHFLLTISDGKIAYVKEYMDTEHMRKVLLQGDGQ